jgi:hypothetical protein
MRMQLTKWSAIAVSSLALLMLVSVSVDADVTTSATGGTVAGTVTNGGQPVVNAKVRVFKAGERKAAKAASSALGGSREKGKKSRPDPMMTAVTDGNGQFSLADMPAGEYVIIVSEKGEGRGHQKVTVVEGQSASVTITLAKHGGKGKGNKGAN